MIHEIGPVKMFVSKKASGTKTNKQKKKKHARVPTQVADDFCYILVLLSLYLIFANSDLNYNDDAI